MAKIHKIFIGRAVNLQEQKLKTEESLHFQ